MGLIETTISAASSSSRRGIFSCDALSDSVLLAVGRRPAEPYGGNYIDHEGKLKVRYDILAPNFRTIQKTWDLTGFWQNSYAEVRKELRGRYPKHPWPEKVE